MLRSIIAAIVLFFASIFGGHQAKLPENVQSQPAAAIVAVSQSADLFQTGTSTPVATTSPSVATPAIVNNYVTQPVERVIESQPLSVDNFVTQSQFNSGMSALSDSLAQQISGINSSTYSADASPPLGGGAPNTIAAAGAIDQLNGTTLNNVEVNGISGLTTSDIPDLSGKYLSLNGGTLTGALISTASATSTFANGFDISAGCFSINGTCITGGGSGGVGSGAQGQFAFYNAAGTTLTATSSLYLASSGNVGIGTTSTSDANGSVALTVQGMNSHDIMSFTDGTIKGAFYIADPSGNNPVQFGSITNSNIGIFTNNGSPQVSFNTNGGTSIGTYANSNSYATPPANGLIVSGNVGIGTANPYSRLQITGPDTASTGAFAVVNSASTTEFSILDNGNAALAGNLQIGGTALPTNWAGMGSVSAGTFFSPNEPGACNVKGFGAVGDGVTDDTTAIQNAVNYCFGTLASPHGQNYYSNNELYFPPGHYIISAPITFPGLMGARIEGAGRFVTTIQNTTSGSTVFATDGAAFTDWSGFQLIGSGSATLLDLNWDGTEAGDALQSNTFENMFFSGGAIGVDIGADGYMGSENLFENDFWDGQSVAGLKTENYNALQNTVVGGDFQSDNIGIWMYAGSVSVYSTGFQISSTWDIEQDNSADDAIVLSGIRTESTNFFDGGNGETVTIEGVSQTSSTPGVFVDFVGGSVTINSSHSVDGTIGSKFVGTVSNSIFGRDDWLAANYLSQENFTATDVSLPSSFITHEQFGSNQDGLGDFVPTTDVLNLFESSTTPPTTFPQNSFALYAPASIPTSYQWVLPSADGAGAIVSDGEGTPGHLSIVGLSGTGNIAMTNNPVFQSINLISTSSLPSSANILTALNPGTFSTVAAATTFIGDSGGWNGYTIRDIINNAELSNTGLGAVRVTIEGESSGPATVISGAYIGPGANSGSAYDFASAPVPLTFNGGSTSVTIPVGGSVTSDPVPYFVSGSHNLVISMYAVTGGFKEYTDTGWTDYYGLGNTASQMSPSSDYYYEGGDYGISLIEAAPGALLVLTKGGSVGIGASTLAAPSSYTNTGGTGDRTGSITVTTSLSIGAGSVSTLVGGNDLADTFFWNTQSASENYVRFDFGASYSPIITEATFYQDGSNAQGTWKWQGSNDGSSWTDIGGTFTLGGADGANVMTTLEENVTPYRYYQILGVSGSTSSGPWDNDFDFKLGTTPPAKLDVEGSGAILLNSGNVGIGTTSPYSRLEVWGPDAASTSAFAVVNSASTSVFAVYDSGNSTYSGSIFQSSDQRLKTDIASLDASSSLAAVEALNPVSYLRLDQPGQGENLGFLAQQVQQVLPQLVSTTSATALTPGGTLTLNYEGLIAPIVSAIQALSADITSIENTIAGFAQSFVSNTITANNELCVGSTCVTPAQFQAMVAAANASQTPGQQSNSDTDTNTSAATTTITESPIIQINGDNPAIIQVGATYNDLGATITGPQADLNLGIETYLNGAPTSNIVIDTSEAATDTIDYVASDQTGLTSTSTRIVIIEVPAAPSIVPTTDASTTATTTSP